PPAVPPDGGYPAARAAAERIARLVPPDAPVSLAGVPAFKRASAIGYPLVAGGRTVRELRAAAGDRLGPDVPVLVVVCDPLFEPAIGRPCGGPAEEAALAELGGPAGYALRERFSSGPRRTLSVYLRSP
ncbi:MAG TPA: hypothetical protein VNJ28_07260, partial [Candidatus Limnocylindrales bacterium]|nr:hypothetical protein [Candidatus Limnocylindrales bacterium]